MIDNASLIDRTDINPTLAIFRVRPDQVPPAEEAWFLPGQYVTLGVGEIQRAYSIASEPDERRWLEFYIRYARDPETDSPLTHRLWTIPVGGRLHVGAKIAGRFTLERTSAGSEARGRLLVAAGTGLAPFVSMVRHARRRAEGDLARIAVLHGASHPQELAYREELADAASRFGLAYRPTVSRPAQHPEWIGLTGRVETLFDDSRLGLGAIDPSRWGIYVCGFRDTIAETIRRLIGRGFVPEDRRLRRLLAIDDAARPSLFFEQYDLEPLFDPKDEARIEELRRAIREGRGA
ncbi:MAG TPA: hypothetical protein VFB67_10950 [Candidatus Polarisedimenticolaceae bacterium]|nr:hypothetical protein [Candidatus Polarisedimenticolaceae bacterium]